MAHMIFDLGDFSAVVKPAAGQEGDLARLAGYWTSGIVAEFVNPYRFEPTATLPGDDATTALPQ